MECSNPEANTSFAKYTLYEELSKDNLVLDESFFQELEKIKDSPDWKELFDTIDVIRKLNKFHPETIKKEFAKMKSFLISNLSNLRSNLVKNGLMLVKEIFIFNENFLRNVLECNPELLSEIIPLIYEKANNDKAFLKTEAKEAIQALENNAPLNESLLKMLLVLTQEKNFGISEKAAESLGFLINLRAEEILTRKNEKDLYNLIVRILAKLLDSGRMAIKKQGEEILKLMMKTEDFEMRLNDVLEKRERDLVIGVIEAKKRMGAGKGKESLKDFLSKKKQP